MSIRMIRIELEVRGIDVSGEQPLNFLVSWARDAVKSALVANPEAFSFRNKSDADITAQITELSGKPPRD